MKKQGYTLTEILVTLGIIGVIAATMIPMVNKYKPDVNKVKFLKTYDAITYLIQDIATNTSLYPLLVQKDSTTVLDYSKCPILNTYAVNIDNVSSGEGKVKFCNILAHSLSDNQACTEENMTFSNKEGVVFNVEQKENGKRYDITVDINGAEGNNCIQMAAGSSCKSPDRFKIAVLANGYVEPLDNASKNYVQSRSNWRVTSGVKNST